MNILYINHYAGCPDLGMEYRPYYLAREWVRAGHAVQIVAADFSHVRAHQPRVGDEVLDGIHYRWYATPAYEGNGVGRAKNIWTFLRAVWADTPRLVQQFKPQVVIASSTYPMDIWVARRIARRAAAKLVFEVHDLWPLSPIELSGMFHRHPFAVLCQHAEDDAYRDADVVVSMLPKVHAHMAARGLDLKKLHVVPNGISLDEWEAQAPAPAPALSPALSLALSPAALGERVLRPDLVQALAAARASRTVAMTVVGYAGSMGLPNALDALLDAAALVRHEALRFVLVGSGHEQARLARRVQDESLYNVVMLPPIPKLQVPAFLASIDIAYIGWQRVPIYRFGIAPNKLMDYMMAGCAVLHAVEAGNDPVAEAAAGLSVAPESATAVAQGLLRLAAMPASERQAMGQRGRAFVLAHHTYPVLARRFLDALV